jgi:asparaginyl-tRNA synthetase
MQAYDGEPVTLGGWIRTLRDSKSFGFIELNDGTFFKNVQLVLQAQSTQNFEQMIKLNTGSAILAKGIFTLTPNAKQPFEIKVEEIVVQGESAHDFPLQKKRHSMEYLRTIAHLRPRANLFNAVFRVRSILAQAIHRFFAENGFVYVHTPIITGSDCEGAGEMFRVTTLDLEDVPKTQDGCVDFSQDFFTRETNLTVSGQLSVETFCMAFRNVYTFGPTFRAENSNTTRHAAEFWMIEPEMAFAGLDEDMENAEQLVKYLIHDVLEQAPEEIEFFNSFLDKGLKERLIAVRDADFARITYTEAIELLQKSGVAFENPPQWGNDLQTEHERYITEKVIGKPVFVTDYPKDIKAFYMRVNDDGKTVAAMDLLVPGIGEIIGGSQREERMDHLKKRMAEMDLDEQDYWWYLDLRKYGTVKHCGYGLGFERMLMYVTGVSNIRDVIPFPRTVKSAEF